MTNYGLTQSKKSPTFRKGIEIETHNKKKKYKTTKSLSVHYSSGCIKTKKKTLDLILILVENSSWYVNYVNDDLHCIIKF